MRIINEYKQHAEQCRNLAQRAAVLEDKRAFEEIAAAWEMLANLSVRNNASLKRTGSPSVSRLPLLDSTAS